MERKSSGYGAAPGRLDVMGGISDYSGALVLQMPLRRETRVRIRENGQDTLRIQSHLSREKASLFEIPLSFWVENRRPDAFRTNLSPKADWAAYPLGCVSVFSEKFNWVPATGFDLDIESDVPLGKGVSSSAAIEVATLRALADWQNQSFSETELARLAQKAENLYVGAPCGLMDQLASAYGVPGTLLPIVCQPDLLSEPVALPEGLHFLALDSGIRHAVTGASYGQVRTAAAMGFAHLAAELGFPVDALRNARETGLRDGLPFEGYLANISPSEFTQRFEARLPETQLGSEFLRHLGETSDPLARIDNETAYGVRQATRHPIMEHFRTGLFLHFLKTWPAEKNLRVQRLVHMGECMYQSHASYSACGLGHLRTDAIVEKARQKPGIFGAKITGGGSGGMVCLMVWGEEGQASARAIQDELRKEWDTELMLLDPNEVG
jgi:galactokinase